MIERNRRLQIGRRPAIVGGATLLVGTALVRPAFAIHSWWATVGAGVASALLAKAIENWDLVPGYVNGLIDGRVAQDHQRQRDNLQQQGLVPQTAYRGQYSAGDIEISEAKRGEAYAAIITTDHNGGTNVCSNGLNKIDAMILGLASEALRQRGLNTRQIQAATMPMHGGSPTVYDGSRGTVLACTTPSHGSIRLSTNPGDSRQNGKAEIRSPVVSADVQCWHDGTKWRFTIQT
jgi:hypothetical protein